MKPEGELGVAGIGASLVMAWSEWTLKTTQAAAVAVSFFFFGRKPYLIGVTGKPKGSHFGAPSF